MPPFPALAYKSASVPIFVLGISAFGKNAPQGRFAALLCPSAVHGAQLRIARFPPQAGMRPNLKH
jgi:hypothetical protein